MKKALIKSNDIFLHLNVLEKQHCYVLINSYTTKADTVPMPCFKIPFLLSISNGSGTSQPHQQTTGTE